MSMKQTKTMFNSDLTPMFNGCVMMNESAKHDEAIMNVLTELQADQFKFRSTNFDHVTFDQFIGK